MLEAFQFAKAAVQRAYEQEGLLVDRARVLDDNGDKEGSADPSTDRPPTARWRALLAIGSAADAAALPTDPKLRALSSSGAIWSTASNRCGCSRKAWTRRNTRVSSKSS